MNIKAAPNGNAPELEIIQIIVDKDNFHVQKALNNKTSNDFTLHRRSISTNEIN